MIQVTQMQCVDPLPICGVAYFICLVRRSFQHQHEQCYLVVPVHAVFQCFPATITMMHRGHIVKAARETYPLLLFICHLLRDL